MASSEERREEQCRRGPPVQYGRVLARSLVWIVCPRLTCRFGPGERQAFYSVFAENMRDLGTPVHSRRLFDALAEIFPSEVIFGVVYYGERPVAGGCGFLWSGEFEITWASALRKFNRMAPNMLLYWSFMEHAIERELTSFNFGRCTPNGGTHRFKLQWGSRDVQLYWYSQATGKRVSTPSPRDPRYAWAPRLWSKLPVTIANLLGPKIVRYIP